MKFHTALVIALLCGMLAGCSSPPPENQPVSDTSACGDFTLTISTEKSVYKASELKPGHLLDFKVSYTYTGDKPEIEVWCSSTICSLTFFTAGGECLMESSMVDDWGPFIFHQNEPHSFTVDGSAEYDHLGSFKPGDYKAVARMKVSLDEEQTQKVECKAEIPFTVY